MSKENFESALIEDEKLAWDAAQAEKPMRDLARDKELKLTKKQKAVLDEVAEKKSDLVIKREKDEKENPKLFWERKRTEALKDALEKKKVLDEKGKINHKSKWKGPFGPPSGEARSDMQPSEAEWENLIEFSKNTKIHQVIVDLHSNNNTPIPTDNYKDLFRVPSGDINQLAYALFRKWNLPYRLKMDSEIIDGRWNYFVKLTIE
ncbi:MAG TPA: hypothetical protein VE973_02740 [Candidatus Limnocylindria bacterium]|nr:hypothetical protein [Candidatus Limnocylindria bacterium]